MLLFVPCLLSLTLFSLSSVGDPPVLLMPLEDLTVVAPNDAILECDIDVGEPEAEIKWFKGQKQVKKSAKYEMSYEDEIAALVIHNTEIQDADVYRCEASNALGMIKTEGSLVVHSKSFFFKTKKNKKCSKVAKKF